MSLSFDPDQISLPIGHFIGDRLVESPGVLPMPPVRRLVLR